MFIERCGADEEFMLPTHVVTMDDAAVACNETKAIVTFHNNWAAGHRASGLRSEDDDLLKPGRRSTFYRYMFDFKGLKNEDKWKDAFQDGTLASFGITTFFPDHIALAYARAAKPIKFKSGELASLGMATAVFKQLILPNLDQGAGRVAPILFALMSAVNEIKPPGAYSDLVQQGFVYLWLAGLAAGAWNPNALLPPEYKLPEKYRKGAEQEFEQMVTELNTKDRCREARQVAQTNGIFVLQDDSITLYPEAHVDFSGNYGRIVAYYDAMKDAMVAERPEGIVLVAVAVVTSERIDPSYAERFRHSFRYAGTGKPMPLFYKTAFIDLAKIS
tara:strand:- start:2333 stop:3325 length:993 start_codon:yes stop_codon:yes gene_type:complete